MTEPRIYKVLYIEVNEDVYEYAENFACANGESCLLVNVGHLLHAIELDEEDGIEYPQEVKDLCNLASALCDGDIILGVCNE
mgnify:CR=1 FL=1